VRGQLEERDPGRQVGGRVFGIQPQLTATGQTDGQERLKCSHSVYVHHQVRCEGQLIVAYDVAVDVTVADADAVAIAVAVAAVL
jgi:hypothetical protein